ncbi:MrcB family domain-containing protein [Deinococcus pimensis]|uniref:MrcB family domain-containing protein n=1 Tax=Deinococcus pimensis TaxID=309888 RepID=UPI000488D801|nr:DUF3578 domain-containing protein [Deinococcus pimensis]
MTLFTSPPTPLRDYLQYTLAQYATKGAFGQEGLAPFVRRANAVQTLLKEQMGVQPPKVVKWSYGKGNWAQVPWLAVLDQRLTSTTKTGVYVVYLFRGDMSGVYLTLAQGVTELVEQHGGPEARRIMRERAARIQAHLGDLPTQGFSYTPDVQLHSTTYGADYEASVIAHKYYDHAALPTEADLQADLRALLAAYTRHVELGDTPSLPIQVQTSLTEALQQEFNRRGLTYTDEQIETFFTALQTKGFVIISGISGTGKSKIAQAFAEMLRPVTPPPSLPTELLRVVTPTALGGAHSLTIPKAAWAKFDVQPDRALPTVVVTLRDMSSECRLVWTRPGEQVELILMGEVLNAFRAEFREGDRYWLLPQPHHENEPLQVQIESDAPPMVTSTRSLFLSVKPDWRDSKSLLGYYNPLTRTYVQPTFLRFVLDALHDYEQNGATALPWFVILDEMNLAHVEHYFAEVLSVMESGRDEQGLTMERLQLDLPWDAEDARLRRQISLPPNLYLIGTVNLDETTHAFSPKVLDRAFSLEFTSVDFSHYPTSLRPSTTSAIDGAQLTRTFTRSGRFARIEKSVVADEVHRSPLLREALQQLNLQLSPHQLHFGYRVFDEIAMFTALAGTNHMLTSEVGALDAAVAMKVLPKFNGGRDKLWVPLVKVAAWAKQPQAPEGALQQLRSEILNGRSEAEATTAQLQRWLDTGVTAPTTAARVARMLQDLERDGFTAFG